MDQSKKQELGNASAGYAQHQNAKPSFRAWHRFWQGQKGRQCQGNAGANLTASGRDQWWHIGHVLFVETACQSVANDCQQACCNGHVLSQRTGIWIGRVVKTGLVVC